MTIGDLIRAARKSRGLTQNELAHAMGITGSAIGQYECGVRTPKYETVERISSALSVPTSSLMPGVSSEIERLTNRCARYAEEIAVAQERTRWIPVTERLPEVWHNGETAVLVNYMIYSPYFGVDIGNYHAKARTWLCMGLPITVTHWMPLPAPPEEVE